MMKEPEERYPTILAMLGDLRDARDELVYRERMKRHEERANQ